MKFHEIPYERPDIVEVTKIGEKIAQGVKNAANAGEVMELYGQFKEFYKNIYSLSAIVHIRHTLNTKDEYYDSENDFFDENEPLLFMLAINFYREMVNSKFRPELEEKLGEFWFLNAGLRLKGFDEKIISEMQQENAFVSKYEKLLASASIEFDGKKNNLSQLRAYQLSADRDVRKAAYAKRTEFFLGHEEQFDEIYDKLVGLRHEMAKKLGYDNFVPLGYIRMSRNSYDSAAVERFRNNVKAVLVPFLRQMHETRREKLGIGKLKFYDEDIYFSRGNPVPKGTPDEMFQSGKKMYNELSSETKEFFSFMLENDLFDVLAKEGKSGGGYCSFIPKYGYPFVFANFNGTSEDVDVLTHECGHALCSYLARDIEIIEYQDYTSDIAEIHSMSMEFFTGKWMDLFFKEDSGDFLHMQLASALAFIPYGCMVDEFQHIVYGNPGMTPKQRKQAWQKLEAEYKPHLDYDGDPFFGNGGHWVRQHHIFSRPFYYIDYCLAQSCALQYRILMEKDRSAAWDSYISLLKKAGTKRFTEVVSEAGLISPFDDGCMEAIVAGVKELWSF